MVPTTPNPEHKTPMLSSSCCGALWVVVACSDVLALQQLGGAHFYLPQSCAYLVAFPCRDVAAVSRHIGWQPAG